MFSSREHFAFTMNGLSSRGHIPRIYCDLPRLSMPTSPMTSCVTNPYLANPYLPIMPGTGAYVDRILGRCFVICTSSEAAANSHLAAN